MLFYEEDSIYFLCFVDPKLFILGEWKKKGYEDKHMGIGKCCIHTRAHSSLLQLPLLLLHACVDETLFMNTAHITYRVVWE